MNIFKIRHKLWVKGIAILVACLLFFNTLTQAYPGESNLATQLIGAPVGGVRIRDEGIIKCCLLSLSKVIDDLGTVKGDINMRIPGDPIDVSFKFLSEGDEAFDRLINNEKDKYIVRFVLNKVKYYGYFMISPDGDIAEIRVFTEKEFSKVSLKESIVYVRGSEGDTNTGALFNAHDFLTLDVPVTSIAGKNFDEIEGENKEVLKTQGRSVIDLKLVSVLLIVEAVLFVMCQFIVPDMPLKSFVSFIPEFMNTDLRSYVGFLVFLPVGEIFGQFVNLRKEGNFAPELRDFNWKTTMTTVLLVGCFFGWFWPWTYNLWLKTLPGFVLGLADQIFTAPISMSILFVVHGLAQKISSNSMDLHEERFKIKDLLQEKLAPILQSLRVEFLCFGIGLGIVFSCPGSVAFKTLIVAAAGPIQHLYLGYLAHRKDVEKIIKVKTWTKRVLPVAMIFNLVLFPLHVRESFMWVGLLLYLPILIFGFKEVDRPNVGKKNVHKSYSKEGGSPADHLIEIGERADLQGSYTVAGYMKNDSFEVSENTVRRNVKKNIDRRYIERSSNQGERAYQHGLTEAGRKRIKRINDAKLAAKKDAQELVDILNNMFINVAVNYTGEKVLLAVDDKLGKIAPVWNIIKELAEKDDSGKLKRILKNVIIIRGRGKTLADEVDKYVNSEYEEKVEGFNVIMVADTLIEEYCKNKDFADEAVITFVDDSKLSMAENYYPVVEIVLFTLARALHNKGIIGFDDEKLGDLFASMNAEMPGSQITSNNVLSIILKPAEMFEYDDLQHIYRNIQKFLKAA